MKLLLFTLLTQLAFTDSIPKVGFLRIFNCMPQEHEFKALKNNRSLTGTALRSGDQTRVFMVPLGEQKITLKSDSFTSKPISFTVHEGQSLNLIALVSYANEQKRPTARLIAVKSPGVNNKNVHPTLNIKSFSHKERYLTLNKQKIFIPPSGGVTFDGWTNDFISLSYKGQPVRRFHAQGTADCTLIIWDDHRGAINCTLIEHLVPQAPKNLRANLSWGKTAKEIPGLYTP